MTGWKPLPPFFNRLLRLRRMPIARDRLKHTYAVTLGVSERDILPHTGDLHRLPHNLSPPPSVTLLTESLISSTAITMAGCCAGQSGFFGKKPPLMAPGCLGPFSL